MQEISEDLCQAIGESPAVGAKLAELQAAGYSLNLLLDCRELDCRELDNGETDDAESQSDLSESGQLLGDGAVSHQGEQSLGTRPAHQPADEANSKPNSKESSVGFRINANDLAFLRSVGIDPTKYARSKSSRAAIKGDVSQRQTDEA